MRVVAAFASFLRVAQQTPFVRQTASQQFLRAAATKKKDPVSPKLLTRLNTEEEIDQKIDAILSSMGNGTSFDWKSAPIPVIGSKDQLDGLIKKYDVKKPELPADLKGGFRFGATAEELADTSPFVQRIFSLDNASQMEINKYRIQKTIERFQPKPFDTGASEAQIAALTERISYLTRHMNTHKKDFSTRRGLNKLVQRRRKLMIYLRERNYERYHHVRTELKLRAA